MKDIINRCKVCSKPLSGRQTMFCSSSCKNKVHQSYRAQKERSLERKLYFVRKLGGKCSQCGYKANLAALSFHHRSGKEYKLDSRSMSNRGITAIRKEIEKCELLCSNCHMELHHPSLDLAKMSIEPTALTTELQARVRTSYQFAPQKNIEPSSCRGSFFPPKNLKNFGDPVINNGKEIIPKKSDIVKKFQENMLGLNIKANNTIVVGVSGGVDSVVLLSLLNCLETKIKPKLIVAHLNHGYREDSDNDEIFVSKLATNFGLKFASKKIDRHSNNLQNVGMSSNLEEYFRDERRKFLLKAANDSRAEYIALGHNADDQAETVIMNLVRGSGPAGLGGMHMSEGKIIRPLLNITKSEIESYAVQNSIEWHEDSTNQDPTFDRNYTRHYILPLLSRLNPEYLESISRSAWIQRRVDDYIKSEALSVIARSSSDAAISATEIQKDCFVPRNDGLSCEKLCRLDKPILYEVFGQMYEAVKGDRKNLDLKNLRRLEKLISKTSGTKEVSLPSDIIARRSYAKLDFLPKMRDNKVPPKQAIFIGENAFGEWQIETEIAEYSKNDDKYTCFVPDLTNLAVRTMAPGDKIKLLGTGGTKKLQDVFTDAKIDREKRKNWPIIEHSGEVIWVPGLAYTNIGLKKKNIIKIKVRGSGHEENTENPPKK